MSSSFLKKIYENPGITRDNLKNIVHVHPSNTTRAIDYLEEKGYITKTLTADDKRICMLFPTNNLEQVYNVLCSAEEEWVNLLTDGLSKEEIDLFIKFLNLSTNNSINCIHKK